MNREGFKKQAFFFLLAVLLLFSGCRKDEPETNDPPENPNPLEVNIAIFPTDNPWNTDISGYAIHANSANFINAIGAGGEVHPNFGTVWEGAPNGIPYVVVAGSQAPVPIHYTAYGDESDPGPFPIPDNAPIEGGANSSGDRHVIVIDRDNHMLYELYKATKATGGWEAESGAKWSLNSNAVRPMYWTSADAAGLPIFPGLVRYLEVQKGEINHALRFTVEYSQRGFIYPARHFASDSTNPDLPPMGLRLRLKAGIDISGFSASNQVILRALKKYGMIVADNGSDWFISGAPDSRWNDDDLHHLHELHGRDFEVVYTGETER
ncbi:MAG: hypothetical protein NTW95_05730 [Candidatus Aminicenantes bacterium]|nr:hypothetical protein [Candidatus Aminicenantes bacterium]